MPGWLVEQLPRALSSDRFTRRFIGLFEETADGIRAQIDSLDAYADVSTAPPEFIRWLGGWLATTVDPELPVARQQAIVRAAGRYFPARGTAAGLRGLIEAITGGEVRIVDGGGVWPAGQAPPNPGRILVRVAQTGQLEEAHLWRLIAQELPVGITFELRLDNRTIEPQRVAPATFDALPQDVAPPDAPAAEGP